MRLFFLFLLTLPLLGKEITLEWLKSKPRSIAKDYYIWRYLHQDITPAQATEALQMAKRINRKLLYAYAKKAEPEVKEIVECMKMPAKKLLDQDSSCIAAGITPFKLSLLSKREVALVLQKTKKFRITPLAPLFLKERLSFLETMRLFNASSTTYRKNLDRHIPQAQLHKLSRSKEFGSFVKRVVFSDAYPKLAYSLLLAPTDSLDTQTAFHLAMNAIRHERPFTALVYLHISRKNAYHQRDIDRANFWIWRIRKDEKSFKKLLASWDLNIYTILAKERGMVPIPYSTPHTSKKGSDINISDPFVWKEVIEKASGKENFFYQETLPIYALLLQKESRYKNHPFIMPYNEFLGDMNASRKALIYAIARQESRFIPGSVSRSYALGMMQFMPFLAKKTAQEKEIENFDLDMMFEPKVSLEFANHHLDYLQKHLKEPLFIAYAYNGGIGFAKRLALPLFCRYDPLLAMELVPYSESRKYGKKVLTNYYIYKKILGEPFSIWRYFETLRRTSRNLCGKE